MGWPTVSIQTQSDDTRCFVLVDKPGTSGWIGYVRKGRNWEGVSVESWGVEPTAGRSCRYLICIINVFLVPLGVCTTHFERRKAPYLQRGFSFFRDRSPFSVAEAPTWGEREGVTK